MEKTKRYCTLISAILSILGFVAFSVLCWSFNISFGYNGGLYVVLGTMLCIALLNIMSFIKWRTTKSNYKKLLWFFIITSILEVGLAIFSFVIAIYSPTKVEGILLYATTLIYLLVFILMLIDIIQGAKYKDPTANEDRVSRPFTLSAGITSLVIGAALFVVMIWGISELASYGFGGYIPFIIWLNMASSAVVLTFGIITTCLARTRAEKYKRLRGLFLTAFITNSLQALISLIYVCVGGVGSVAGVINLITILGCAMAATFFMLDYARKDRAAHVAKLATQPQTVQPQSTKPTESELAKNLREIKEMKEAGLINDEDYEKLKSNILSNYKF